MEYFRRIDPMERPSEVFDAICRDFEMGDFQEAKIIEIGYEDFNVVITTSKGKYFVKIFANVRNDDEVAEVVQRAVVAVDGGVSSPSVYQNQTGNDWSLIKLGSSKYRAMVEDYINGEDFFTAAARPTEQELDEIVDIAAALQKVNFQPDFIYDSWAISSFLQEFEKKERDLTPQYRDLIEPIYQQFKNFDYEKLPRGYTHGDIISTNLIKSQDGRIWLVDYSVANWTARLNEIAVIACDVAMIPDDAARSRRRIERVFTKWCEAVDATDYEKAAFPLILSVAHAMHVMSAAIEKQKGNKSAENQYFLKMGLIGLS